MASAAHSVPQNSDSNLYRIGEVSRLTDTKPFVLRFWESEFPMLQPVKSPSGHRLYRREDIATVIHIKRLLYEEGFTIAGARKHLSQPGVLSAMSESLQLQIPADVVPVQPEPRASAPVHATPPAPHPAPPHVTPHVTPHASATVAPSTVAAAAAAAPTAVPARAVASLVAPCAHQQTLLALKEELAAVLTLLEGE